MTDKGAFGWGGSIDLEEIKEVLHERVGFSYEKYTLSLSLPGDEMFHLRED